MEAYIKLKKAGRNLLLAICDVEILGKTIHDGKIVFHVKEDFYKGAKVNIDEAIYMIESCARACGLDLASYSCSSRESA